MAGTWYANWLFMLAMLGVGVAVIVLAMMWLAEYPLAQTTSAGAPSMSTNPLVDYHVIYAIALVVVAVTAAGATWGLGRVWADLPVVRDHRWAL